MAGLGVKVYTDEDVHKDLAPQLRLHGYDAASCREKGNHNRRLSDEEQLEYAKTQGWAIVVHNVADYVVIDQEWKARHEMHFGIIVVHGHPPIGELVRRLRAHLDSVTAQQQYNLMWYA
ncbi:MAG: DUF5615 family PIN-like protein [Chloroflexota bacterium]